MHMCLYNERYTSNKTIYVSFICICVCTMEDIRVILRCSVSIIHDDIPIIEKKYKKGPLKAYSSTSILDPPPPPPLCGHAIEFCNVYYFGVFSYLEWFLLRREGGWYRGCII